MPLPVRARTLAVLTCLLGIALTFPTLAAADNGGFTPKTPESPGAEAITDTFYLILALTAAIFLLVTSSLLLFIVRFRSRGRPRSTEGPQVRGNTRLELAWTGLPVLILAAIATFVFIKLPSIDNPSSASAAGSELRVTVKGYRFYWQFEYPNGAIGIDDLRLPVGRVVDLAVTTAPTEVQHSWWIPSLGGKIDAIPGRVNHMKLLVKKEGTYVGQCAEFCGIQHAAMLAKVEALPTSEFDGWVKKEGTAQRGKASDLGEITWHGACSKCHGPQAQGYIGPRLQGNPIVQDRQGLETVIRYGRGMMPRVGPDWDAKQIDALQTYMKQHFGQQGGASGGG